MTGWIGVDLDGTLARYDGWKGPDHIGAPIPMMVRRVQEWLKRGQKVKIFTARAAAKPEDLDIAIKTIQEWCLKNIGVILSITCQKDFDMIELWDDRAVQVVPNTGERADGEE